MCQQMHTAASGGGGGVLNGSSYYYKCVLIILNVSSYTAKTKKQLFSAEWVAAAAITDDKIATASAVK